MKINSCKEAEENMATLAERLRELRKAKGLQQKEVAAILQITERHYVNYEGGKGSPPLLKAIKLADFFDVSLDYLVGRVDTLGSGTPSGKNITRNNSVYEIDKTKNNATFKDRIRECRLAKGLTQKKMGVIFGLSERAWQTYELGTHIPPAVGLAKLADYFGVSIDWLMGRTDKSDVAR